MKQFMKPGRKFYLTTAPSKDAVRIWMIHPGPWSRGKNGAVGMFEMQEVSEPEWRRVRRREFHVCAMYRDLAQALFLD